MAEESSTIDYWRNFFRRAANPDIFNVIRMAIRVAAFDSPAELRRQGNRLAALLQEEEIAESTVRGILPDGEEEISSRPIDLKRETDRPIQNLLKMQGSSAIADQLRMRTDCADEEALRSKIELSKKKLRESYEKTSHAKRQRTVRMVMLRDAIAPPPDSKETRRCPRH
ncbi:uncharacterized protein LOC144706702 [Wolffia australiana]